MIMLCAVISYSLIIILSENRIEANEQHEMTSVAI